MKDRLSAMGRIAHNTVRVQLTDSSQLLSAIVNTALSTTVDWDSILAVTISCETYDCRLSFGVSASTTVGHLLMANGTARYTSSSMIQAMRLINKTVGENSIVQITLEY